MYCFRFEQRWLQRKAAPGYIFQSTWNSPDNQEGRKRINHVFRVIITSAAPFSKH
jgi:hypothetical protein